MKQYRIRSVFTAGLLAAVVLAACGSDAKQATTTTTSAAVITTTTTATPKLSGSITVLAASSLTGGFTELGKEFEAKYPGTHVTFSFGASSTLVQQIQAGAPADVFASADEANMKKIETSKNVAGAPTSFAKNRLEIAVEPGNPKHVATLADLAQPGLIVVLCASEVPCGKFADQVLAAAKVTVTPKSREANVKATLGKIELGEADAAIVYVTDVFGDKKVGGVEIPDAQNIVTMLPVASLTSSKNSAVADAFVKFVSAPAEQKELVSQFGFLPR
jgi:molybdate transport system substrate-binding protein